MKRKILFIIAATMLLFGCKKYIDYSAIKFEITNEELVVTSTTATLTADYSWPWKVVSIAMEVSEDESLDNAKSFEASVSGNSLTVTATGLKAETTYYYRMRLNMEDGKVESEKKTLKTAAYILPTVTTSEVTNISGTKADCRCNVTSEGDFTVTARGVCWSTADNPTIDDSHTVDGGGAGSFTSNITGLTENTTYYVRAYATSSAGTAYGATRTFKTTEYIFPTVTTSEVDYISAITAKCGGEVTEGDYTVTARGVCWSTADNPTIDDSHTVDGGGAGAFISNITGLTENTTYYVRAYATSGAGTAYGETMTFETNNPNTFTVNGVSFEMVYVEGGSFDMGATTEQGSDAYDSEYPVHSVTLSDYYIGRCEVTQELWLAVMGSWPGTAPSNSYGVGANYPAYYISWNDCQNFIKKLNSLTGRTFRLPTEAEWEYAARGGNKSSHYKYSGSGNIDDVAWYSSNSGSSTHAVGTKSLNELGICDMSGNVQEWCSDWWGSSYSAGAQTNPQGPSSGSRRVHRGGSWSDGARSCRVSYRYFCDPSSSSNSYGLRLVLVP